MFVAFFHNIMHTSGISLSTQNVLNSGFKCFKVDNGMSVISYINAWHNRMTIVLLLLSFVAVVV